MPYSVGKIDKFKTKFPCQSLQARPEKFLPELSIVSIVQDEIVGRLSISFGHHQRTTAVTGWRPRNVGMLINLFACGCPKIKTVFSMISSEHPIFVNLDTHPCRAHRRTSLWCRLCNWHWVVRLDTCFHRRFVVPLGAVSLKVLHPTKLCTMLCNRSNFK